MQTKSKASEGLMSYHIALIGVAVHLLQVVWAHIQEGSKLLGCDHPSLALDQLSHLQTPRVH